MGDIAIRAEGLGKRYFLRKQQASLRIAVNTLVVSSTRKLLGRSTRVNDERVHLQPFWALRDVSFEVKQGEVVGIIGKNGSGKSTLLKVLSRITNPTEGRAEVRGRLGVMLEVGSGFHPELTGRENVYMNGSILGMKRHDITQRFDSILEFSEIKDFIDTPVKYYSSGMYVRLAFSVAAHLDAEVLLIDEVLAVGDQGFRRKSQEKIQSIVTSGRSIIIVTHMIDVVKQYCNHMMLLEDGHILMKGHPYHVVDEYKTRLFGENYLEEQREQLKQEQQQLEQQSIHMATRRQNRLKESVPHDK